MGVKRTYLLWLWMQTAWNQTFSQGNDYQVGLISSTGSVAFDETMSTMKLELPMLVFAEFCNWTVYTKYMETSGLTCADIYE